MIRLFYSNRTDRLAEALIQHLRPREASLLDPVSVIVPNLAVAAFLKHTIAEKSGIAANLELLFLERYLLHLVEETDGPRVVNLERMQAVLLRALQDGDLLGREEMQPVREYLSAAGEDPPAVDLRRFQLARHLAKHFDEYVLTRRSMLEAWETRTLFDGTLSARTERWQRAIWKHLRSDLVTLPDAFDRLDPDTLPLPPRLHLFDVSLAAPAFQAILAKLQRKTELFLYALNPCLEFWEDVLAGYEIRGLRQRLSSLDPIEEVAIDDTPALSLWGRPGRENIRLLNGLTDCDHEARFAPPVPAPPTLLARLQQDVLLREPARNEPDPRFDFEEDESILFLACPGLRREVEVIAQEIWALVERFRGTERPLRFNEIAVVLTGRDQEAYRAHIGAVFDEFYEIPHGFLDVPLTAQSRVVEAVELLLALPYSRFTRQELLRLITHPAILAKVDDADPEEWLRWADELSIVHGADHSDHENTYIERDLYNWEQGLLRLVLGTFMSGQASDDDRVFCASGQDYLPYEYPMDRIRSASTMGTLVRSLIADARFAEQSRMTLADWADFFRALFTSYVGGAEENDERDLFRCLSAVAELKNLDPGGPKVSFRVAAEFARQRLSRLTTNLGTPLAEGVVVGPLQLTHALPFRAVFVTGMGEGRFPTSDKRSQLDLRFLSRVPGDVTPRERDQYRFLQTLMSVKDAVRISWISRDPQTGEDLMPSPVVMELFEMLKTGYLGGADRLIQRHALRRYRDLKEGAVVPPNVARERQVLDLKESLRSHLGDPEAAAPIRVLRRQMPRRIWHRLSERLRLSEPEHTFEIPSAMAVRYEALRRFLEDPLQGWARLVLELSDEDEVDPFARQDELFATGALHGTVELRAVLIEQFRRDAASDLSTSLEELYRARANRLELEGMMPTGIFGRAERTKHERILQAWQKQVRDALNGKATPIDPVRFGRARERAATVEPADPISLEVPVGGRSIIVELHGQTQPALRDPGVFGSVALTMKRPYKGKRAQLLELRGFMDQVVLAAAGIADEVPFTAATAFGEDDLRVTDFAPFTRREARDYLRSLLADMLSRPHAYLLPFGTVLDLHKAREQGRLGPRKRASILANARPDPFGPLVDPEVDPPTAEEIDDVLAARFGPYFERRRPRR